MAVRYTAAAQQIDSRRSAPTLDTFRKRHPDITYNFSSSIHVLPTLNLSQQPPLQDYAALRGDEGANLPDAVHIDMSAPRSRRLFDEGQHIEITHRDMLPFRFLGQLGLGGSAVVETVEDQTTGQKFAHKFFGKIYAKDVKKVKDAFKNEIDIMKRLQSHSHRTLAAAS